MKKLLFVLFIAIQAQAQSFDFSCSVSFDNLTLDSTPDEYLSIFLDDLYYTTGEDYRDMNAYVGFTWPWPIPPGTRIPRGWAAGVCDDNNIRVYLDEAYWNSKTNIVLRLFIIYHEIGHDLLNLKHIGGNEIMNGGLYTTWTDMNAFLLAKDRMFKGTNQVYWDCINESPY